MVAKKTTLSNQIAEAEEIVQLWQTGTSLQKETVSALRDYLSEQGDKVPKNILAEINTVYFSI